MPRLSDSMEEGTVLSWLKSVGDDVAVGDELVEIETDKANMVYEADEAGTLVEIVAEEGATLPIGDVIARLGEPGEEASSGDGAGDGAAAEDDDGEQEKPEEDEDEDEEAQPEEDDRDAQSEQPRVEGQREEKPEAESDGGQRVKASPLAKRIARERGVDLSGIAGSGPGGRIVKADVEGAGDGDAAAPAAATEPAPERTSRSGDVETAKGQVEVVELSKLQATVARRMAESKATAPHFYLQAQIDMTRCVEGRARLKETAGDEPVPSFNDMVIKASALALREYPRANGAYRDGRFELYSRVNVGVAVAGQDALVVPTVFDADRKGLRQIAEEVRELAGKVREGKITPPELSGGTFTVSNLGMYGIDNFAAVINSPQAGILAVGAISERPVARDGEVVLAQMMDVTLACDHRILYGADGAEFLSRIRALLEEPLALAL
jgi:pyruvate dehydrogenase E2 component (dihydrolipoamide acetyltransferase)